MRLKIAFACALFALAAATSFAQAPGAFTIHSGTVIVSQDITPTSQVFTSTGTTTAQINGVAITGLKYSGYGETTPTAIKVWGVMIGALANGDQINMIYQRVSPVRNRVTLVGTLTYKIVGGTGVAKGITGSGTCTVPPPTPTGNDMACAGSYAIP
ncbi:MAG: hypothetical protein WAK91_02365 [Candidatus Acidiferrales bacterium]|jgi:hypothetical protein